MKKVLEALGLVAILLVFMLFVMVGSAYAFQAPPPAQQPQLPLPGLPPMKLGGAWWHGLLVGIAGGIQATFVGMMKKKKETGEFPKFDLRLGLKTLGVGIVVGLVAHLLKWSPNDTAAWFVTAPMGGVVTAGVEDLVDLIWKKLGPPPPLPEPRVATGA